MTDPNSAYEAAELMKPAAAAHAVTINSNATVAGGHEARCCTCDWAVWHPTYELARTARTAHLAQVAADQVTENGESR